MKTRQLTLKNKVFHGPPHFPRGKIERHQSSSQALGNSRTLDIYLPPGYDVSQPQRRYPVLYMHDGNNLFYPEIAFGGMPWGVDRVLDRLIALKLISPLIVVGVYNTLGRNSEYTWTPMRAAWGSEGGEGPRYAQYLTQELKPRVDRHYHTLAGPQYTGVMGSSLGGLISLYLGLYYPQVFGHIGMVSPSLWWNHGEALKDAWNFQPGQRLWLDMGTREGGRRQRVAHNPNILNTRYLKRVLEQRGYQEGQNLAYLEARGGMHNEWWWGQRVHLPLLFFFGTARGRRLIFKSA